MAKMDYLKVFYAYVKDVTDGKTLHAELERLAVERHLSDLKRHDIYFDIKEGLKFCNFFNLLKHFKGPMAGEDFILEPWQVFCTMQIFGWRMRDSRKRRFNYADIIIPRKNGKSTYAAGLALACLTIDGEMGAEVYSAGTDREQAKVVWETAKALAERSEALRQFLKPYQRAIVMESTASTFKPLSRDLKNKDGSNPSMAVCDERHAWPSNEMFEVLKSGTVARKQPLILTITTAGRDKSVPYFEQMGILEGILRGKYEQDNQFVMMFVPDRDMDWNDEATWYAVNPGLGKNIPVEYFRKEYEDAKLKGGTVEANFKTKNLNIWVDAPEVWISDDKVAACDHGTDKEALSGKRCYAGLDIASHVDINALALIFPEEEHMPVVMHYWIPEAKAFDPAMKDRVDYRGWAKQGWMHLMQGDVLDTEQMATDIAEILRNYDTQNLSFDPYKAYHGIIQSLQKDGLGEILDEYSQGIKNMSEPTKKLESLVLSGSIDLMGDPVLRWMFGNVVLYRDPNDNIKVHKGKSRNKVDGVVALVNAIGGWMSKDAQEQGSIIYASHDLRSIHM